MGLTLEERYGIFHGESGGDYNALFGFQNRPGGKFENVRLTDMTIDEALQFAAPSGEYGQSVKADIGRVATPMGAYQIVGTTLRAAKEALGLTGQEKMDAATQDRLADWIAANQGLSAWEGYKGPRSDPPKGYAAAPQRSIGPGNMPMPMPQGAPTDRNPARLAWAYANGKMTPEDAAVYERGMAEGVFPKATPPKPPTMPDPMAVYAATAMRPRQPFQPTPLNMAPVPNATPFQRT